MGSSRPCSARFGSVSGLPSRPTHPADRQLLSALHLQAHLSEGGNSRCHIEHDRCFVLGRDCDCDRVRAQQVLGRAPRRQVVVAADGEIEPDHVMGERHHGVERRRPGMVAHSRAHPGNACSFCLLDRRHRGKPHDQVAHAVVAVDKRGGRTLFYDPDMRTRVDSARLQAPKIKRQADHTMRVAAAQIGLDHQSRDNLRVRGGQTRSLEGALDESRQCRRHHTRRIAGGCDVGSSFS